MENVAMVMVSYHYTAWWLGHPSEKYEFVNWDDEIPNSHGKIKNGNQTTNQYTTIAYYGSSILQCSLSHQLFLNHHMDNTWQWLITQNIVAITHKIVTNSGYIGKAKSEVLYGDFLKWGYPNSWMDYFMENTM